MTDLGIKIFRQEAKFIAGVARSDQFPKLFLPQIAFFGKSNVGKSSLINAVCKRKALARVSHTPGRTQQINFFNLADKMLIADLPGYGFAKVPKIQKANWEKLILYYLSNSENLQMVNLLIDARRGIKENDLTVMELLKSSGKTFQIVFTKADKVKNSDILITETAKSLETYGHSCNILITSSKNGFGSKELQFSMVQAVNK